MTDHGRTTPAFGHVDEDSARATRDMFNAMLRWKFILLGVILVAGTGLGWLFAGMPGVWAALLGAALSGAFALTTVILGQITADKPIWVASGALLGGWLAKMVILFAVLIAVRGQDFYNRYVLFGVVVVAIIGSTAIEVREAMRARVPYTAPTQPAARRPEDAEGPEGHAPGQ
ncbi:MAG: hypothetical protein Q4G64_07185 [bacterium]|nr:hypothetical protein [bacterium]